MVIDAETNFLYLADTLVLIFPDFYDRLCTILNQLGVRHSLLHGTKDIWARDYMPIQINGNRYVQFQYNPNYLQGKIWQQTITDVNAVCNSLAINPYKTSLVVDGGNVIKGKNKVILCDKLLRENKHLTQLEITQQLTALLEVEKVIYIPQQPYDPIGHADGMVRFIDEHTILINDYSRENPVFQKQLYTALRKAKLEWISLPYNPYQNKNDWQAHGTYINYLHLQQGMIAPTFNLSEDEKAITVLQTCFPQQTVLPLQSKAIAEEGGVLNCITWTVQVDAKEGI